MDSNTYDNRSLIINKTWTLLDLNELFNIIVAYEMI